MKKVLAFLLVSGYTFLVMNNSLTATYFASVASKLSDTLVKGMKTNYGIFSHWNGQTAIFESGWVGYESLHFIEIQDEANEKKSSDALAKMLRANGLRA
jgi:hypothetical protein